MDEILDQWIGAFQEIKSSVVLKDILNAHHVDIIDLNQEQLKKGIKSTDGRLSPYSTSYAKRKRKPRIPKTLYDTGDFYDNIYSSSVDLYTIVGSKDSKAKYIEAQEAYKSGDSPDDIYGLTDENLDILLYEYHVFDEFADQYVSKLIAV